MTPPILVLTIVMVPSAWVLPNPNVLWIAFRVNRADTPSAGFRLRASRCGGQVAGTSPVTTGEENSRRGVNCFSSPACGGGGERSEPEGGTGLGEIANRP